MTISACLTHRIDESQASIGRKKEEKLRSLFLFRVIGPGHALLKVYNYHAGHTGIPFDML